MLLTNSFPAEEYYVSAICSIFLQRLCVGISITKLSLSVLSITIHSGLKPGASDLSS